MGRFKIVSKMRFQAQNRLVKRRVNSIMKVGYIRVSTKDQNTARQEALIKEIGAEKVFMEKVSGKITITDRPQLEALMNFVREGDAVVVESISRFGRNIKHFLELLDMLQEKQVEFISIKEKFDTSTPSGRFMVVVFAALAELEREYILERQAEGIAVAKAEGRFNGRPQKVLEDFESVYKQWKNGTCTAAKAARTLGIARSTFYRRVSQFESNDIVDFG